MTADSTLHSTPHSEDEFLALINRFFPPDHSGMILGRGDDCAVLDCPSPLCLSTDIFLEDVHFRRSYFRPEDIGYKSLAVNICDIAAMGAMPLGFALNLMTPGGLSGGFWTGFFHGMSALAAEYGLYLAGGDLSRSACLGVAVTIWGKPGPGGRFLRRCQGRPGDVLFVVGEIGLARTGLALLEDHPDKTRTCPASVRAHLRPVPRVREALALAGMPGVRGLMDVSDGLVRDLPRFLGPNLGCKLRVSEDDLHPEVLRHVRDTNIDPLAWALLGGEDYALLGAADPGRWHDLKEGLPEARNLGVISGRPGLFLNDRIIEFQGFDHFQPGTALARR